MTHAPHTPLRTCVGCRTKRPQAALVRVVLGAEGRLSVSRTAPGRGAWLCDETPIACLQSARKRRGFDRAFRQRVDVVAVDGLADVLTDVVRGKG